MSTHRLAGPWFAAVVLITITTCTGSRSAGPWRPEGLPGGEPTAVFGDHLAFGLRNDPADLEWMTQSGVPWAARYTYLAGGVNTGGGWATWSAKPGEYATTYARRSALSGFVPVFSYYQLQQSKPGAGTTEAGRDFANLIDPGTMRAYYSDFVLLMRSIADMPRSTVVHVEPDLWAYLQQRNPDPNKIPAMVRSSGHPDVQDEPDTAVGFAHALLDIRDRYAPRALLALHASSWSAGRDIVVSTMDADPAPFATATARFLNKLDRPARGWDLVFHDIMDRDAAMNDGAPGRRAWWDPQDQTVPDFARWLAYVHALSTALGRRIVVWQVPVGNQRYRTMDNTPGHYQDNRAEYFLAHPDLLAAAGIAAVLFGPGIEDATWYTDARKDGITNPDPTSAFGCDGCNADVAVYPDDDGGFLRLAVGTYYHAGGVALPRR